MAEVVTFTSLKNKLASRSFAPVYLLTGEESFYIDELIKLFDNILPEADRVFDQYTVYAPETDAATVVEACQRYPMMAEYQVVIVKEAQVPGAKFLNALASYAANPSPRTILAIIARGRDVRCAELTKAINKSGGVVFESKKLWDNQVGPAISALVTDKGLHIEPKAQQMLQDFIGADLAKINNELDKLASILGPGAMVTPESIERNIGISKDFNNLELVAAISQRNGAKAYQIVNYFKNNPRNYPYPVTAAALFNFFANLFAAIYAKDRSEWGLTKFFGFKSPKQITDILNGLCNYNAWQMIAAIDAIRDFDVKSKGIGSRQDPYDLLTELVFTILNTTGR